MDERFDKIHVSVDAVIIVKGHLLVCNVSDESYTYLPGGRIEPGELMEEALKREMMEELRKEIRVGRYLGCIDQLFQIEGEYFHEVAHQFIVAIKGVDDLVQLNAYNEVPSVSWKPIDRLTDSCLKPDILRFKIPELINNENIPVWQISQNEINSDFSV